MKQKPVPLPILALHDDLSGVLDEIKTRFKGRVKVTLIVRNLDHTNSDVVLADDDTESAIATLRGLENDPDRHEIPKGSSALELVETEGPTQ